MSARVGSIEDNKYDIFMAYAPEDSRCNRIGGWYSYRMSKAAQNMLTKNLSIELRRKNKLFTACALHPGTVDTDLSAPFSGRVKPEKLFSKQQAVSQLLDVIDGLTPEDNGRFVAWDGSDIPW